VAQELKQTAVNSFVKGLITEASPLTYPENASVDELNCSLHRTGVRSRRKGIEHETNFVLSSFTFSPGTLVHTSTWKNVSGISGSEFLVIQIGGTLYFYDKANIPISATEKSFSVNLNTFNAGNGKSTSEFRFSGTSVNGNFVVVSEAIESFYIEYDVDTDTISTTQINPRVRDFEWQGDVSGYGENISAPSATDVRKYDTYNCGWVNFVDLSQEGTRGVLLGSSEGIVDRFNLWPALTHPWWAGKDQNNDFDYQAWQKVFGGNSLIGNGRFILDLYNKDRATASGVPGLPIETDDARFSSVAGFAGRVWFSGLKSKKKGSRIYFSSVVENMTNIGNFYQEADPASEDSPDLVDSDGGVINIPNASNIIALFEMGASLLVFAENGVWEIKGVDGVFKAGEFSVSRIPEADGITNLASLVDAEGVPYWWGKSGIFTITGNTDLTQSTGRQGSNLSLSTIQTFWEAIPGEIRNEAIGNYDDVNNRIFWLYAPDATVKYKFTKVLILDTVLGAFIPWAFTDAEAFPEVTLYSKTWTAGLPIAQVTGTDHGSGVWAFNRGTVALGTGTIDTLTGIPVLQLTSTDTDGTVIEAETGRIGTYIDLVDEGYESDVSYLIREAATFGGLIGDGKWRLRIYTADAGGSASVADQETTFMPPDAHNITEVLDSTFQTFPGPGRDSDANMTGRYISYVFRGGNPNLGFVEVGPINLFIEGSATSYPVGMSFFSGLGGSTVENDVVSASGVNDVVSASGVNDVVVSQFISSTVGETDMKFIVRDDSGSLTFAGLTNTGFLDWGVSSYNSYAEAAYDFEDDMTTHKHGIYTTVYFDITETGFDVDEITHLNPSSCIMSAFWDLKATANSSQEVYRFRLPVVANPLDLTEFNYPYDSVVSRNRIRGRGRNLKLRFESSPGKDFQLQGYEVINAKNRGL
jgi:hypothetical protein